MRILLGAAYSVIEPLGLLHLAGLARDLGWQRKIILVKDHDFEPLYRCVKDYRPDVLGFNIYTGNHLQTFEAFARIRKDFPQTRLVLGGPHATYFPSNAAIAADYVVMSEGFRSLSTILTSVPKGGIFPLQKVTKFPLPDRGTFYADYPEHAKSRIKSAITMTGCSFACTYCVTGDTPIHTTDGLVSIETLVRERKRIRVFDAFGHERVVSQFYSRPYSGSLVQLGIGKLKDPLKGTPNHEVFTADGKKPLGSLKVDDFVRLSPQWVDPRVEELWNEGDRESIFFIKSESYLRVKSVEHFDYSGTVYNLGVEEEHSYTANLIAVGNCYNSTQIEDLKDGVPPEVYAEMAKTKGIGNRLFPLNVRSVDDVITECHEIAERWPETKVIYFQDDIHGFDIKPGGWMQQLAERWPKEVGIPYHAQMRWEMVNPKTEGRRRIDLVQQAGCFGLTLAIEAADPTIRKEVLDRAMPEELMFDGMRELTKRGLRIRTEQITGLPYGATTQRTKMNLEADLELVELNVRLLAETGGPTMAWASTLAPYKRTKMGAYCERYGHYVGMNEDVPDTFFDRSVLRFPKAWIGPKLRAFRENEAVWLSTDELECYRNQNAELRNIFNFVTLIPDGHVLARNYLTSSEPYTFARLGEATVAHLITRSDDRSLRMLGSIRALEEKSRSLQVRLRELVPFFGCLPKGELAMERFIRYAAKSSPSSKVLSTATRHHLYDEVLYNTDSKVDNDRPREGEFSLSRQSSFKI
jgi:radical SAM superfamily enzyme YgiQ (UPF0313 family)